MVSRLSATLVLLWAVLTVLAVVPVAAVVYAQLNCEFRSCVEVRYKTWDANTTKNVYCVRTEFKNDEHWGYAFSSVFAVKNCYGQNSVGGTPTNFKMGHRWDVLCAPDCGDIPNDSLCSGMVVSYKSDPMMKDFPTKCFQGVDEPPQPDPGDPGL
ncbi:MAG: hypothetical protein KatS3mg110_4334 [Pirellulaceae bacterium]|nr:MAG: hypothetical protein KatS3mg110_4334 [Pirellulaceae bacterium]